MPEGDWNVRQVPPLSPAFPMANSDFAVTYSAAAKWILPTCVDTSTATAVVDNKGSPEEIHVSADSPADKITQVNISRSFFCWEPHRHVQCPQAGNQCGSKHSPVQRFVHEYLVILRAPNLRDFVLRLWSGDHSAETNLLVCYTDHGQAPSHIVEETSVLVGCKPALEICSPFRTLKILLVSLNPRERAAHVVGSVPWTVVDPARPIRGVRCFRTFGRRDSGLKTPKVRGTLGRTNSARSLFSPRKISLHSQL
jgi:hypothetical protein